MEQANLFYRFGVALFIGLLVGLQREFAYADGRKKTSKLFAGDRTLALMGLAGCTAAYVADVLDSAWGFVVIVLILGLWIGAAYLINAWQGSLGMTTEVASLITILAGALCYWDQIALAAALAVATTVVLSVKLETDLLVQRLTRDDLIAVLKFAVITAIVLPILPDQTYGPPPFDVLNPRNIWLMVVFISGISFLGYVLVKAVGPRQGIGLTGLLGGLASSTAVTLSFTQRSQDEPRLAKSFALAIVLAWTVMFGRVLVEVFVLNRALFQNIWIPMMAAMAAGVLFSFLLYLTQRPHRDEEQVVLANPFELGPAIKFGLLYAIILLVARAAELYLGSAGVLISSVFAGMTDVDAITISMAQLSSEPGGLALSTAALAVVVATISNTLVKGGIVLTSGASGLRRAILPGLILMVGVAAIVVFLTIDL